MKSVNPQGKTSPLHPRNRHRFGYDFTALCNSLPELSSFVRRNQYGNLSIDFADPMAVKMLNKALLLHEYKLTYWDIPNDYLCPPIPGRADYIHHLADLLAKDNQQTLACGKWVRVLDIGVGANGIYPIIGQAEYGWSFVGSDINPAAIKVATVISQANPGLRSAFQCRLQKNKNAIFDNIIQPNEYYLLTLCNPPFDASAEAARSSATQKLTNLAKSTGKTKNAALNFGGQHAELWCEGGESAFIGKMIDESQNYKKQCLWFTSLVSKKDSLAVITKRLKAVNVAQSQIIDMAQGQKKSRFVAWTFFNQNEREQAVKQCKVTGIF